MNPPEQDHQKKTHAAVSMLLQAGTQVSAKDGFFCSCAPAGFLDTLWLCPVPLLGLYFCLPCCREPVLGDRLTGSFASKLLSLDFAGFCCT